jgi:hypothetical protein
MRRAVVVVALLVAGCSTGSPAASLALPQVDPGVATEVRVAPVSEWVSPEVSSEGLTVTLGGCTVRYPGRWVFDLEISAPSDIEFPVGLGLIPSVSSGDTPDVVFPRFEVTIARPGAFSIDAVAIVRPDVGSRYSAVAEVSAELGRSDRIGGRLWWEGLPCRIWVASSPDAPVVDALTGEQEVAIQLASPEVNAPPGSVQRLAQEADLTDLTDPGRVWAYLYGYGVQPAADRVWLDPTRPVRHLEESWSATNRCYRLLMSYSDDGVSVTQSKGCPLESRVADHARVLQGGSGWTLVVAGEDRGLVDSIADQLTPFGNIEPAATPPPEAEELGVLEFDGHTVYVIRFRSGETEFVTLESSTLAGLDEMSGANGETWRGCWQTTVYQAGVALITVGNSAWEVTLEGAPLVLTDAGGLGVAVIAWPASATVPMPTIHFPAGTPPCE